MKVPGTCLVVENGAGAGVFSLPFLSVLFRVDVFFLGVTFSIG